MGRRLDSVRGPADLRALDDEQIAGLAVEIREFLVTHVARGGGHLGPNLGVVELTLALHRVFDSPARPDPVRHRPPGVRAQDRHRPGRPASTRCAPATGLSGYPSRAESEHDWIENSHASTSLSYADGLAKAFALRGETDRTVVAVIGDGALTGGMAWEALNNIAAAQDRPLVIVAERQRPLLRADHRWDGRADGRAAVAPRVRTDAGQGQDDPAADSGGRVGPLYSALHAMKSAVKDWFLPQTHVRGPGAEIRRARSTGTTCRRWSGRCAGPRVFGGPVLVHCLTQQGPWLPAGRGRRTPSRCTRRPRSTR